MNLKQAEIIPFQQLVLDYFRQHGRTFPWRETTDPYAILVSELMLQQTQTERVIPKFIQFLKLFPTITTLAEAAPAQVITAWQGLGYNRRALNLQKTAQMILRAFHGQVPTTAEELLQLPGIGPYTAAAILAFAFHQPTIVIETNIRTVYIHHFFAKRTDKIADQELSPIIEQTLDRTDPQQWYSALMDYGAFLKLKFPQPHRKSKHYQKQSPFKGSRRQVRGALIRLLTQRPHTLTEISDELTTTYPLNELLLELQTEGFIELIDQQYRLTAT